MEKILNQILEKLNTLEEGQKALEKNIRADIKEVDRKVSVIFDQTAHLTEITSDLHELKQTVSFLAHKEFETEKDVFTIKKHLEIIK